MHNRRTSTSGSGRQQVRHCTLCACMLCGGHGTAWCLRVHTLRVQGAHRHVNDFALQSPACVGNKKTMYSIPSFLALSIVPCTFRHPPAACVCCGIVPLNTSTEKGRSPPPCSCSGAWKLGELRFRKPVVPSSGTHPAASPDGMRPRAAHANTNNTTMKPHRESRESSGSSSSSCCGSDVDAPTTILDLPDAILICIATRLDMNSLASLRCSCTALDKTARAALNDLKVVALANGMLARTSPAGPTLLLQSLLPHCPLLTSLCLKGAHSWVGDSCLQAIAAGAPQLVSLDLEHCSLITGSGLEVCIIMSHPSTHPCKLLCLLA